MQITIFNTTFSIERKDTQESIKRSLYDKTEANALYALEKETLDLLHKRALKEKVKEHNRTEAEIKGIDNAIELAEKAIGNWTTQLEVIRANK